MEAAPEPAERAENAAVAGDAEVVLVPQSRSAGPRAWSHIRQPRTK